MSYKILEAGNYHVVIKMFLSPWSVCDIEVFGSSMHLWAFLVAQTVKNQPAMQEIWVRSLGFEDPLEKGMAAHFAILAWRISWTEEPGGLQSMGSQKVGHDWAINTFTFWIVYVLFHFLFNLPEPASKVPTFISFLLTLDSFFPPYFKTPLPSARIT